MLWFIDRETKNNRGHTDSCPASHREMDPIDISVHYNQQEWADPFAYAKPFMLMAASKDSSIDLSKFEKSAMTDDNYQYCQSKMAALRWGEQPTTSKEDYNTNINTKRGMKFEITNSNCRARQSDEQVIERLNDLMEKSATLNSTDNDFFGMARRGIWKYMASIAEMFDHKRETQTKTTVIKHLVEIVPKFEVLLMIYRTIIREFQVMEAAQSSIFVTTTDEIKSARYSQVSQIFDSIVKSTKYLSETLSVLSDTNIMPSIEVQVALELSLQTLAMKCREMMNYRTVLNEMREQNMNCDPCM